MAAGHILSLWERLCSHNSRCVVSSYLRPLFSPPTQCWIGWWLASAPAIVLDRIVPLRKKKYMPIAAFVMSFRLALLRSELDHHEWGRVCPSLAAPSLQPHRPTYILPFRYHIPCRNMLRFAKLFIDFRHSIFPSPKICYSLMLINVLFF